MSAPVKKLYKKQVYRCFHSVHPTQHLLDDIGLTEAEQKILESVYYPNDLLKLPAHERVLKRAEYEIVVSDIQQKFTPATWMESRFCNGSWAVIYTAEGQETSVREKTYHSAKFYQEESKSRAIVFDLAIAYLNIKSQHITDLTKNKSLDQKILQSPDQKSYSYCQEVAKESIDQGAEGLRSKSARDEKGVCLPIFTKAIIEKDKGIQKWLKCEIENGQVRIFEQGKTYQW